jgi:hypothetical protein
MAVVELTREQLIDAVRQLPEGDRIQMIADLLADTRGFPQGDEAAKRFKRLRGKYRLPPRKEQRISALLSKQNQGTLCRKERRELDDLLDESQQRMLQLALAVMFSGRPSPTKAVGRRGGA